MNVTIDISNVCIETERLILRPWHETDLMDFFEYASVAGVGEMAGWKHHQTLDDTRYALDVLVAGKSVFALVYKENLKVIGSLGFHISWANDDSVYGDLKQKEIGYSLSKDYWGQGLMPEAVKALIDYFFTHSTLEALTICHFLNNYQSRRVIEKCGFRYVKSGKYYAKQLYQIFDDCKYILLNPRNH